MANEGADRRQKLAEFARVIEGIPIVMLTTHTTEGRFRSRPMLLERLEPDATLLFLTNISSEKINEVKHDPRVSVAFVRSKGDRYVSAAGRAEIIVDASQVRDLWNPTYRAWFPHGPDDPEIAILKVRVERLEYWDVPANPFVRLWSAGLALVRRRPIEAGEHKTLVFD
jgi:general stress protein 26